MFCTRAKSFPLKINISQIKKNFCSPLKKLLVFPSSSFGIGESEVIFIEKMLDI